MGNPVRPLIIVVLAAFGCVPKEPMRVSDAGDEGASPSNSNSTAPSVVDARETELRPALETSTAEDSKIRDEISAARDDDIRISAWLTRAHEFKPPGDRYPQIIQSDDYETTLSIEVLFSSLRNLARDPKNWPLNDPPEPLSFKVDEQALVVTGTAGSISVTLGESHVSIAGRRYKRPSTVTLFRTLHAVLLALSSDFEPAGVLGTQYGSRAYQSMTRLGFSCGPLVVELEGAHNGSRGLDGFHVLDLVRSQDSFLWRPAPHAETW